MTTKVQDTNKLVAGVSSKGWYDGRRATTVRQRCNLVGGTYFALNYQLPPRARIVWFETLVNSTITVSTVTAGPASAAPGGFGIMLFPAAATATTPVTAPPSTATQAFTSLVGGTAGYIFATSPDLTTAVTSQVRGIPLVYATNATNIVQNTATVGGLLALVPVAIGTGLNIYPKTDGYYFGSAATATTAAGQIDVTLYVEEYDQAPVIGVNQ